MASQHSTPSPGKDDKSRQRPQGSPQDGDDQKQQGGSSHGNDNAGNFANDPDRARKAGQKGGRS